MQSAASSSISLLLNLKTFKEKIFSKAVRIPIAIVVFNLVLAMLSSFGEVVSKTSVMISAPCSVTLEVLISNLVRSANQFEINSATSTSCIVLAKDTAGQTLSNKHNKNNVSMIAENIPLVASYL